MSLRVTCACGKSFVAQPKLAGKTVACPACGGSITVPSAAPVAEVASSSTTIHVACTCGKTLNAKPSMAGKKAKCPACGSSIVVPAASMAVGASGHSLSPLDNLDPFAGDPLGLGDFDEQALGSAPVSHLARPAPQKAKPTNAGVGGNKSLRLGLSIGAAVVAVTVLVVIVVTMTLPAIQKLNEPAPDKSKELTPDATVANVGPRIGLGGQPLPPGRSVSLGQPLPPVAEWVTHTSYQDGYSVLLPKTPELKTQSAPNETINQAISQVGLHGYVVVVRHFSEQLTSLPGFRIVEGLDAVINEELRDSTEVVSRKSTLYDGHPARDVTYKRTNNNQSGTVHARYIAVNKSIYCLVHYTLDNGEADKNFFDSFKLLGDE